MADYILNWKGDQWIAVFKKCEDEALIAVGSLIVEEAMRNAPRFIGNLARSVGMSSPHDGPSGYRELNLGFLGGNEDAFRYAMSVELGRRAGKMPPWEALRGWVEMKLGAGRTWAGKADGAAYSRAGSRRMAKKDARETEIDAVAFLVARAIGRKGTRPHPFLIPAFDRYAPKLAEAFKAALERHAGELPQLAR